MSRMKTVAIMNPTAGGGRVGRRHETFATLARTAYDASEVHLSRSGDHAAALLHAAIDGGATRVVLVGGDGSFGDAMNAVLSRPDATDVLARVSFAPIPGGTGSDLARSLVLSHDTDPATWRDASCHAIDLGRVTVTTPRPRTRAFLNVASVGVSAAIARVARRLPGALGGVAVDDLAAVLGFVGHRNRAVDVCVDGEVVAPGASLSLLAVANGRYFGAGMKIAPDAVLDDGALDVVLVRGAHLGTFVRHARSLNAGTHGELPFVDMWRGRAIEVRPGAGAPPLVDTDGETVGAGAARFDVLPAAVGVWLPSPARAVASGTLSSRFPRHP